MKIITSLLVALLLFTGCRAQKTVDNKSLLWRISGHGMKQPSYLFGTIHLLCPGDYLWTDAMRSSLKSTHEVCFEMDMDDPAVMNAASAGMMDTTGKKLQQYFTPAQWTKLSRFMQDSLGASLAMFQS